MRLSELGQAFLRDCTELVGRTNDIVDQMREVTHVADGRGCASMRCPASCSAIWRALLQEFQVRYPQIVLELIVNDAVIDPVKEGFDCALQIFPPRSEELVSRKLFPVRRVFCASPDYLRRHGTPREPRDLHGHRIGWYSGYPTRERLDVPSDRASRCTLDLSAGAADQQRAPAARIRAANTPASSACRRWSRRDAILLGRAADRAARAPAVSSFWLSVFYPPTARSALKLKLFLETLEQQLLAACRPGTRR